MVVTCVAARQALTTTLRRSFMCSDYEASTAVAYNSDGDALMHFGRAAGNLLSWRSTVRASQSGGRDPPA